jgi:hypothetical protein
MKSPWIKYLGAGILLTGIIILPAIALFNVVVYKVPIFRPDKPTTLPELNTKSRPVNSTDIAIDDPIRKNLLTEDQAWEYTWAFLHDRVGFKIFLPMEKRSAGLRQIIDDKGNQYLVWDFYVKQVERPYLVYPQFSLGGVISIDAHDGHVLWYGAIN